MKRPTNARQGVAAPVILIVDDNRLVRLSLKRLLEGAGYRVMEARDGREGLSQQKSAAPDVVVLDLLMPEMDGIELIQQLRKDAPDVAIVAMSAEGSGRIDLLHYATLLGADRTLPKPFSNAELLQVLQELLKHGAPPSSASPSIGG